MDLYLLTLYASVAWTGIISPVTALLVSVRLQEIQIGSEDDI